MVRLVKNMSINAGDVREIWVLSLGWEDPLEKGKATHSSALAWRSSMDCIVPGVTESDMTERLSL